MTIDVTEPGATFENYESDPCYPIPNIWPGWLDHIFDNDLVVITEDDLVSAIYEQHLHCEVEL